MSNAALNLERNIFAGLFVAAFLAMTPVSSTGPPALIASVPFATVRRRTAVTKYGTFESCPAIWNDGEDYGFVLFRDDEGWRRIPSYDLNHNAGIMTKAEFEAEYPNLPPLSKLAVPKA